ncbi:hypothetical protein [Campylobacter sp. MG1]|nr:hypothetical protein [Campylobacter sp. MG1]
MNNITKIIGNHYWICNNVKNSNNTNTSNINYAIASIKRDIILNKKLLKL